MANGLCDRVKQDMVIFGVLFYVFFSADSYIVQAPAQILGDLERLIASGHLGIVVGDDEHEVGCCNKPHW
jgi:hypothetical protein